MGSYFPSVTPTIQYNLVLSNLSCMTAVVTVLVLNPWPIYTALWGIRIWRCSDSGFQSEPSGNIRTYWAHREWLPGRTGPWLPSLSSLSYWLKSDPHWQWQRAIAISMVFDGLCDLLDLYRAQTTIQAANEQKNTEHLISFLFIIEALLPQYSSCLQLIGSNELLCDRIYTVIVLILIIVSQWWCGNCGWGGTFIISP